MTHRSKKNGTRRKEEAPGLTSDVWRNTVGGCSQIDEWQVTGNPTYEKKKIPATTEWMRGRERWSHGREWRGTKPRRQDTVTTIGYVRTEGRVIQWGRCHTLYIRSEQNSQSLRAVFLRPSLPILVILIALTSSSHSSGSDSLFVHNLLPVLPRVLIYMSLNPVPRWYYSFNKTPFETKHVPEESVVVDETTPTTTGGGGRFILLYLKMGLR